MAAPGGLAAIITTAENPRNATRFNMMPSLLDRVPCRCCDKNDPAAEMQQRGRLLRIRIHASETGIGAGVCPRFDLKAAPGNNRFNYPLGAWSGGVLPPSALKTYAGWGCRGVVDA
jgi:hypothetical protein